MKFYKVRRKADGLFSTGTTNPNWSEIGRVFPTLNHARTHISWFLQGGFVMGEDGMPELYTESRDPDQYELVEYEATTERVVPLRGDKR